MGLWRAFIAVPLPDSALNWLADLQARFRSEGAGPEVRWTNPRGSHLTLKFLGDIAEELVPELRAALDKARTGRVAFTVTCAGVGCFPHSGSPRVLWAGVKAPPDLGGMFGDLETGLADLGIPRESRGFSPHLTLGRVRESASTAEARRLRDIVESFPEGDAIEIELNAVCLFRSVLTPRGPEYTVLHCAALTPREPGSRSLW